MKISLWGISSNWFPISIYHPLTLKKSAVRVVAPVQVESWCTCWCWLQVSLHGVDELALLLQSQVEIIFLMGTDVLQNLVNQLAILWPWKELRVINGWTPYKVFYLDIRAEIFTRPSIIYSGSFDTGDVGKRPGARKVAAVCWKRVGISGSRPLKPLMSRHKLLPN